MKASAFAAVIAAIASLGVPVPRMDRFATRSGDLARPSPDRSCGAAAPRSS
jgi:hypothetical protein